MLVRALEPIWLRTRQGPPLGLNELAPQRSRLIQSLRPSARSGWRYLTSNAIDGTRPRVGRLQHASCWCWGWHRRHAGRAASRATIANTSWPLKHASGRRARCMSNLSTKLLIKFKILPQLGELGPSCQATDPVLVLLLPRCGAGRGHRTRLRRYGFPSVTRQCWASQITAQDAAAGRGCSRFRPS